MSAGVDLEVNFSFPYLHSSAHEFCLGSWEENDLAIAKENIAGAKHGGDHRVFSAGIRHQGRSPDVRQIRANTTCPLGVNTRKLVMSTSRMLANALTSLRQACCSGLRRFRGTVSFTKTPASVLLFPSKNLTCC